MKARYDLLIFDWDGTLYDSIPFIVNCLQSAAIDCDLPIPCEPSARSVIGLSLDLALGQLFPDTSATGIEELRKAYNRHYQTRPASADHLFEGIPELLTTLKHRGYRLGIATGKSNRFIPDILQSTSATHWFDAYRGADDELSKPDPRMLQEIMNGLCITPQRTLMIGDSVHDLKMAANASVSAVAVTCGANTAEELLSLDTICCLSHTRELLPMLI